MTSAVDTNVLIDVLLPDSVHAHPSKALLDAQKAIGQLIICEVVLAELASLFPSLEKLEEFLDDTAIAMVGSDRKSLALAGEKWKQYTRSRGKAVQCPRCGARFESKCPECGTTLGFRQHIVADFIVGAHARTHADVLLSRDRGFYASYFAGLTILGGHE